MPLEHLLEDEEFPEVSCLDVVAAEKDFSHVADRKGQLQAGKLYTKKNYCQACIF